MDYESIKAEVLLELELLGLPQLEIDRIILDFDEVVTKVSDDPSMMKRLATDLIGAAKFRANIGIPDTIPDDMIIENIAQEETSGQGNSLGKAKFTDDFFDPNAGKITSLPDNHIFVFGSNTAGRHGKGAALDARNNFGAIPGQGYGLQGQSFGIPTKDGQLNVLDNAQIQKYINNFLDFAKNNPDKKFVVTAIGTGLAGKNPSEIASMFSEVPDNVILSQKFNIETKKLKSLQTDSKSTDPLGKQLSAKNSVFSEGEYAGRSIEDVWQNTVKNKRTPGSPGKSGKPDGSGLIQPGNMQDSYDAYDDLWKQWFSQNPDIYEQAVAKRKEGYTFVDTFGRKGNVRQDETIMRIIDSDWKPNAQGGSIEFPLKKIISGMQKNVDQYGIEAAKTLGLDYGGTVNKGFKVVSEGNNSPNFQEFVDSGKWEEIESEYYPDRTKANAQNADGTVWFGEGNSKGYGATKNYSGDKPWIENPTDVELRQWIINNNIQTLNVAGNRSYGTEELGQQAMNTIIKAVDPNKQGGSLGAAKLNDPNVFETFLEKATADEKKMVKGLDESGKLDDVGGVKGLVTDLVTQYPKTAKVIGRSLSVFLQGAATIIDPIGEAIDLGLKLGGKEVIVGGKNAIKREAFTWALWQASAFGWTQIQDMGNIVNMTLDKVGLLPDWFKDKVDVPQNMEEINAERIINTEKNRRLGNQGYKATSLWWWLDQGIPARLTGLSPIEWGIRKWEYNQFGDITDDEKKFLDIMYGYDTRMEKNKESMFGWWQNEFDNNFNKKYYNEAHINDFRKIEKIKPEYGSEGVELYNDFKELGLIDE